MNSDSSESESLFSSARPGRFIAYVIAYVIVGIVFPPFLLAIQAVALVFVLMVLIGAVVGGIMIGIQFLVNFAQGLFLRIFFRKSKKVQGVEPTVFNYQLKYVCHACGGEFTEGQIGKDKLCPLDHIPLKSYDQVEDRRFEPL